MTDLISLIGNTPLLDLSALSPNPRAKLFGKLEGDNPGGSVKDRAAHFMIRGAEKRGDLSKGVKLIEPGASLFNSRYDYHGCSSRLVSKFRSEIQCESIYLRRYLRWRHSFFHLIGSLDCSELSTGQVRGTADRPCRVLLRLGLSLTRCAH